MYRALTFLAGGATPGCYLSTVIYRSRHLLHEAGVIFLWELKFYLSCSRANPAELEKRRNPQTYKVPRSRPTAAAVHNTERFGWSIENRKLPRISEPDKACIRKDLLLYTYSAD